MTEWNLTNALNHCKIHNFYWSWFTKYCRWSQQRRPWTGRRSPSSQLQSCPSNMSIYCYNLPDTSKADKVTRSASSSNWKVSAPPRLKQTVKKKKKRKRGVKGKHKNASICRLKTWTKARQTKGQQQTEKPQNIIKTNYIWMFIDFSWFCLII